MPAVLLSNRWLRTGSGPGRLMGAAGIAATCVLGVLILLWSFRTGASRSLLLLIPMVPTALVGSVVLAARPRDPVGWSFFVSGELFLTGLAGEQWVLLGLPGAPVAVWLQTWTYQVALIPLFVLAPLYFPDGRLPSRRWRPVVRAALLVLPLLGLTQAFRQGFIPVGNRRLPNPYAAEFLTGAEWLDPILGLATLALVLLAASSLVVRFRSSPPDSRARIALLMAAFAVAALAFVLDVVVALGSPDSYDGVFVFVQLALAAVVLAVAIGVLHHRLLDERPVLDRALLYALLTGCVLLVCVAVVATAGLLSFDRQASTVVAVVLVVAVVPALRGWLQRGVDRLVYGDRADPYRALSLLGRRLEAALTPATALTTVVAAVADALHVPFVAVESVTSTGFETSAAHGRPPSSLASLTYVPLVHAGETVGRLTLAGRSGRLELAPGDLRVLQDLARQVGIALHAVQAGEQARRLSEDLQQSRERLVMAREEERRRIGRDLHDGLGPQLAGLTMTAEAARDLIGVDDDRAQHLLNGLLEQTDAAVHEVRRIAHELRPPALDALGLVGALRSHAATMAGLAITVDGPPLGALPAAVEVAAYRIALEALHNAAAHAHATQCAVQLRINGEDLAVTVIDDGRGFPDLPPLGLGLQSMRDRAAELGGARATLNRLPMAAQCCTPACPALRRPGVPGDSNPSAHLR
ncbi:GAF domain-containing sensor histidine kinase [Modestobacter excelsi]|uniref:GAF domain-containing sensor histidine kinase n=1 Tax=Modestobacter excelsi TaxID=2213161 RepID=UPI00110D11F6|nr:GAF domain-containing sensor histidine kinase [Modestobacter excelsi]